MNIVALPEDSETDVELPEEEQAILTVQTKPSNNKATHQTLKLLA